MQYRRLWIALALVVGVSFAVLGGVGVKILLGAVGALVLGWFVLGLVTGHSYEKTGTLAEGEWKVVQPAPLEHTGD